MSRPRATVQLSSTVNSVLADWSVILEESPSAGYSQGTASVAGEGCATAVTVITMFCEDAAGKAMGQESKEIEASAGPDGVLQVKGSSELHFLLPGKTYTFSLRLGSQAEGNLLQQSVKTEIVGRGLNPALARQLDRTMWRTYVGPEHRLGQWLSESPEDTVWTLESGYDMMRTLWLNACFTLPNPQSPLMTCPNPISRYCLDLTKGQPWLQSKKVRRHKKDFRLTLNADYRKTFQTCERTHTLDGKGTWITSELVDHLDRCRMENSALKIYSIELWEKRTGKLAAAIMALSLGDIFHDYTTATMLRDSRSPGAILTKVVGHLLREAGYTLWYWGFKNPYMAEYDGQYGGLTLDNQREFWPRWKRATDISSSGEPCDLALHVPKGDSTSGGLDLEML
eukprot:TRINITY_DN99700_c0_g1_i1.p1 TRINITY_DN99700_c0_g1~~TRINITY_DN99700_c0_g1_i1.p1  ORF type:complete len:397 (-),score=66.70 TRINITY_DN99700_c0_g1_i1:243-1433(-)